MSEETHPPHFTLVADLLKAISKYTKKTGITITGQATMEVKKPGEPPTVVMYSSYSSGDYLCWFGDVDGKFHLYVLVNERTKYICSVLARELPNLQAQAKEWDEKLTKKNKRKS